MSDSKKRRNRHTDSESNKKNKTKSYWSKASKNFQSITGIEPGIQGIFATCERGREKKCVDEMYGLLEKCAKELYGIEPPAEDEVMKNTKDDEDEDEEEEEDIEAAIQREMAGLKEKKKFAGTDKDKRLFVDVKLDLDCVVFFRTKEPTVPTELVQAILSGTVKGDRKSLWTHRLTPVMRTGKATLEGLTEVAKEVLKPVFHREDGVVLKYAIRPTSRNHSVMSRDEIIKTVADIVGPGHKVDLKGYDLLILVDVFKNICGMSVVRDFEKLGKYNLQTSQQSNAESKDKEAGAAEKVQEPAANTATQPEKTKKVNSAEEKKDESLPLSATPQKEE